MATLKFSAIAAGTAPATTDTVIGVQGGTTDVRFTLAQIATRVYASAPAASSQVMFNNGGVVSGDAGFTYTGLSGGNGQVSFPVGTISSPSLFGSASGPNTGINFAANGIQFVSDTICRIALDTTNGMRLDGSMFVGWVNGAANANVADTRLNRDDVGALGQRVGTAAQAFKVYNTFTDTTHYERGGFDWLASASTLRIMSEAGSAGGTKRVIAIDGFSKAGAAVAADIPAGTWALVRDTSGSTTKLIYNNAGTLMSVALT
jgi:hypothetical protein